jgi:hypothetical protein
VKAPIWVRICAEIIAATKPRLPGVRLMARLGRKTPAWESLPGLIPAAPRPMLR